MSMNARNSMALPTTKNFQSSTENTSPEFPELDSMIDKFQAINMKKSLKEIDGIGKFLDRDHNKSDMSLARKNRVRYQEYLKNFKGKCIPSK